MAAEEVLDFYSVKGRCSKVSVQTKVLPKRTRLAAVLFLEVHQVIMQNIN